jgi:hypothetical protein
LAGRVIPIISGISLGEVGDAEDKDGRKLDHHKAMTGDDLIDFVNVKLFPYLKKFKTDAEHADTISIRSGRS